MKVDGLAALVTGGAQGLGKAFTEILLKNGAKVLFTDIDEKIGKSTLAQYQKLYGQNNVLFIQADVTSQEQMEESFQLAKTSFGRLDILCNNAGIGGESGDAWEKSIDINLKGSIRCCRLAMEYMRRDKGGQGGVIVNIASMGGLKPQPYGPVYSAGKAGLIMYTRSVAANPEFLACGVRISTLCPAFADTQLVANVSKGTCLNTEKALEQIKAVGVMTVEYVAEGFYELVTDDSKNGAVLTMSKHTGKKYLEF
ncbi:15-hydroxyprostaglandin dehydrogenase [NAD(+)]-like [Pomacea canaliculata]|uniref:15-hydroxyprostaglandin dehydrogenase [NAD(+)]-like n=1 Tax=Pomacea canaliculata TaxID=400727 RepID=UPI000D737DE0|nr:15-hydroxyprostaglandin dehydrogenase [NAD(+)]-like [Pomacea canaliculata]